jgi:hypothetical protein
MVMEVFKRREGPRSGVELRRLSKNGAKGAVRVTLPIAMVNSLEVAPGDVVDLVVRTGPNLVKEIVITKHDEPLREYRDF